MKVFYLRDEHRFPVSCVASERVGDVIRVAVVTHNPLDTYDRKEYLRRAAFKLAGKQEVSSFPVEKGVKIKIMQAIASNVIEHTEQGQKRKLPHRAVNAAKRWLAHHWGPGRSLDRSQIMGDKIEAIINAEAHRSDFDVRQVMLAQIGALMVTLDSMPEDLRPFDSSALAFCLASCAQDLVHAIQRVNKKPPAKEPPQKTNANA